MRFADIDKCECNNGLDIGISIYLQGCSHACRGCFNPETWDFCGGKEFTDDIQKYILSLNSFCDLISHLIIYICPISTSIPGNSFSAFAANG